MHFSPTSRITSAMATLSLVVLSALAELYSATMESGEFIVMVAAVDSASHDGRPSLCAVASFSIRPYTSWMCRGAGTGPGRACAAFMRAFRPGASFDIAAVTATENTVGESFVDSALKLPTRNLNSSVSRRQSERRGTTSQDV